MRKRWGVTIVAIVLVVITVGVGVYNAITNNKFWDVSVAQVLTLVVTILIAFWATQFKK